MPNKNRLRPYQQELITALLTAWCSSNRLMLQLPTGGGKTVIFAAIASQFLQQGKRVLILAHREELVLQAAEKVNVISGTSAGIIKAGHQANYGLPLQVASVQSLGTRLHLLAPPDLIVVDEAHHATAATYRKVLEACPDACILGVSATPVRLDGSGFQDMFDELFCGPSVQELIESGYLSKFKLFASPEPMSVKGVRKQQGDYSVAQIASANNAVKLSGRLVQSYLQHCPGKRCIVFALNVEHSREIAYRYNEAGIPALHLDGQTSDSQRQDALKRFEAGDIKVISNCSLFDEGLDIPGIEAVQIAKPTTSLSRWLQMVGRALRPSPGKDYALILDHTKNWTNHGLPTKPRVWSLQGVETPHQPQPQLWPTGEVSEGRWPPKVEESDEELSAVEPSPEDEWQDVYAELREMQQALCYKPGWIFHQLKAMKPPLKLWQRYARDQGYKPGWARHRFAEQQAHPGL